MFNQQECVARLHASLWEKSLLCCQLLNNTIIGEAAAVLLHNGTAAADLLSLLLLGFKLFARHGLVHSPRARVVCDGWYRN